MTQLLKTLAWKPDIPDHRDRILQLKAKSLPKSVARLGMKNPIEDQGELGSCTGNATTSMVEILTNAPALSRLMCYYQARVIEGTVRQDAGAYLRDVIKGVSKFGIAEEALWPYDISKFARKPPKTAYANAATLKPRIASYQRVADLDTMLACLASKRPVVFGFMVPEYFLSETMARKAVLPLPTAADSMVGGHAVMAAGYSMTANPYIWVRNSWGATWGNKGYFKMPFSWFTDPRRLVDDMWTIVPA